MSAWSLVRDRQPELMDDPGLAAADHLHALGALATINALSGTAGQLARGVGEVVGQGPATRPVRVVDVACGGGDVTVTLARRLERLFGPGNVNVVGVDFSTRAIARATSVAARRHCRAVQFEVRDVLRDGCPPCDVAVNSLFLHHLDDAEAGELLAALARQASAGVVVSDLVRGYPGLWLARLGTAVLSGSRVARVDGPLSVRAARTPAEYARLFAAAGLGDASVRRVWPERVICTWRRHGPPGGAS